MLCWFFVPAAAFATDEEVEAQLEAMQERMSQLEDRLDLTTDQLAEANQRLGEQRSMLEKAAQTGPSSSTAAFVDSLEIGGWLSADFWYNLNSPANERLEDGNIGAVGQSQSLQPRFQPVLLWSALVHGWSGPSTKRTAPASAPRSPSERWRGCSRTATRPRTEGPAATISISLRPTSSI